MLYLRILVFLLGAVLVARTGFSAVRTIILPRGANDALSGFVFRSLRRLFNLIIRPGLPYSWVDRIMAYYAPFGLILLLPFWSSLVLLGYMGMYWAIGTESWVHAFQVSGSALLTLGYTHLDTFPATLLEFSEAAVGLGMVALLIAYLPSMYSAFSRRESAVTQLEVRAGDPPTAVEMLLRYNRIHGLEHLSEMWPIWENWFTDLEESHTSLAALVFFRSPQPYHSWVTAAGAVLDAAALSQAAVDIPDDPRAALCIRSGYLAFRALGDFFHIKYNPAPIFPREPISVTREEFDDALRRLEGGGLKLKADREQAWRDFAGWRVNYDRLLLALASFTLAPESPWTGSRPYKVS